MRDLPPWVSSGPAQRRARRPWWHRASDYFFGTLAVAFLAMCALLAVVWIVSLV